MLKYFLPLFLLSTCAAAFSARSLLAAKGCSLGPSYWCKNITNAKNCNAVRHCIQTVWEHQRPLLRDNEDDICGLCKAMVSDARNQLESNETLDMIKYVFQRSCKLMLLKPVVKQCIKFADEYAVELVDMLGSYMSPDIICTLAGLCNSVETDKMYADAKNKQVKEVERNAELQKNCEPCMEIAEYIESKLLPATPEQTKQYFKRKCNDFGSFSVSCTNIIDTYMPELFKRIKTEFTPQSFCHLTSACINGYGRNIQVKTNSDYGIINVPNRVLPVKYLSSDQTCELCKTMVKHLKDILVANTTAVEFKQMLRGICKQTGRFTSECLHLTEQYYDEVYHYLVNNFNAEDACIVIDLCYPRSRYYHYSTIAPVLPIPVKVEISYGDPLESKYQLPIERMALPVVKDLGITNREACMVCQYLLHFIQKMMSQPYGEDALKTLLSNACEDLPRSVVAPCKEFVLEYGNQFVAILVQNIDPSQVCPAVRACPPERGYDRNAIPLDMEAAPGCPLCLLVMEDLTEKLKENRTEIAIQNALHGLCGRMPENLKPECNEFVEKYAAEVLDMLVADFTPQEVCAFLRLCRTKVDLELVAPFATEKHEILTNEIPRGEVEVKDDAVEKKNNQPMCFLCEFVMDKVKDQLKDNETEEDVRRIVLGVCESIPKAIESDCRDFVNKYSKFIVEMLANNVDPRMVCREMHMCKEEAEHYPLDRVFRAVEECAVCEALVGAIRGLLEDKDFDRNMSRYAVQICYSIPFLRPDQMDRCRSMVLSYGPSIINLLVELGVRPELVCSRLELCDNTEQAKVHLIESSTEVPESHPQQRPHLLGGNSCTWGPSYWCQSEDHAKECGTLAHCREVVWKADRPAPAA